MSDPIRPKYLIQVIKGKKSWFWRTVFANGNKLQTSEMYSSRAKALQSATNNFNSYKRGHAKLEVQE